MRPIVIVGGGPAGTVAALALQQAGYEPVVYDASPSEPQGGSAFLSIGAHGMTALAQVGVEAAVAEAGFPIDKLEAHSPTGEIRATRDLPGYYHLRRADLVRVLRAEVRRRGIRMECGRRLRAVTEHHRQVTARFDDGHTAVGALLLGADGLRSRVRRHIDPEVAPEYAGQWVIYGISPGNPANARPGVLHGTPGSNISFGYTVSPASRTPPETFWFARVTAAPLGAEHLGPGNLTRWRDDIVAVLEQEAPSCVPVVAQSMAAALFVDNTYQVPVASRWYQGNIVLLGDAAHAISPANAQGASLAFEDSIMLGKALRDSPDIAAALTAYERLRRPRITRLATVAGRADDDRRWITDYPVHWETRITDQLIQETETTQGAD